MYECTYNLREGHAYRLTSKLWLMHYLKAQAIKNAKAGRILHMAEAKVAVVYFMPV
jgi:hypothetical protein